MSFSAPWFALSSDWSDSEMFDGSTHGVRLAWVELLGHVKAYGRAGKVRLRVKKFADHKKLGADCVEDMLTRAVLSGAVMRHGDEVTVLNWRRYQDPKARVTADEVKPDNDLGTNGNHFSKTPTNAEKDATNHQSPITANQSPSPVERASPRTTRFAKPTIEEIRAYCIERGNDVEPERFFNHYEANGWMVGKNPMRNWKAAIHGTWERAKPPPQAPPRAAHRSDRIDPIAFRD